MRRQKIVAYLVIFFIVTSVIWISRKIVFQKVFDKLVIKTEKRFDWNIQFKQADLTGFRTVFLTDLKISDKKGKIILISDSIALDIKPFPLLLGKLRLSSVSVYNTQLSLDAQLIKLIYKAKGGDSANKVISESAETRNFTKIFNNIAEKIFEYLPRNLLFRNTSLKYSHDTTTATINLQNFIYRKHEFIGDIRFSDQTLTNYCFIKGNVNSSNYSFNLKIQKTGNNATHLPYIGPRWNASFGFDTLTLNGTYKPVSNNNSLFLGIAAAHNLQFFYKQVNPDTIDIKSGSIQFKWNIGTNSIELDSSSIVRMNQFSFSPYILYQKESTAKLSVAFIREEFEAQNLFASLPKGLFYNFKDIQTKGKLAYHLKASIDFGNPDNVIFESQLENLGFSILKYGSTDFRIMNGTFTHEVYEHDQLVKTIIVGPENPEFTPIDDISPFLKYSVLTSEDGDFYYHRGFNEKAFSESIAKNIKENRFARGGSTITMQLVKNVFLSRKKFISRKIEEALIVWIIENQHLVSKDRMFEVYLNIIEWGPGIYGIKAASKFYFNKLPRDLNLSESIYLTSLIPRPKGFKYTFDNNGKLRDYLIPYYQLLSGIMVRRNQILPEDTINLKPITKLTGEARNSLNKPDSTLMEDSLFFLKPLDFIQEDVIK